MADIPREKIMIRLQVAIENRMTERSKLYDRLGKIDAEILALREAQSHVDSISQEQGA